MRQGLPAMIAFLVCGCLRQSPPPSTAFLTVESNTQEFRHVPAGIVQEAAFTITNSSNLPVQLTIRRTSCSCATAELRDSRLASGESTELNLAINTAGFEKIDATVEVNCVATHTNGTQSSEVQLLRASVADISHRYGLQPSALNFGIVRRDASKASLDFRILMPESQLTAQRMETDDLPPSIQVESTGISTLESGDIKLHGRVTITPEKLPIGLRESEFVIPIRVLPQGQRFALRCSLEARHPVAVTPGGIFFPSPRQTAGA